MRYPFDLEQLLNHYGLSKPIYHAHQIPYRQDIYHECIVELNDLYIQGCAIAKTAAQAKAEAINEALDKITALNLFPDHRVA